MKDSDTPEDGNNAAGLRTSSSQNIANLIGKNPKACFSPISLLFCRFCLTFAYDRNYTAIRE